ncbi:MAG: ABC transporter permease [Anaerolineae bacterium]|nr:ABC transporter permease [Anaerolineae bacterium]
MRAILIVARYDLLRSLKQRETFLFGLLMPGIMMLLLGVAMGGSAGSTAITVDVLDEDGSALSAALVSALRAELEVDDSFRLCVLGADGGDGCTVSAAPDRLEQVADERLEDTDSFGTIRIPAGFGDALRAGEEVTLIYKSSADLTAPALAEQKIEAAVSRLSGAVAVANLTVSAAERAFGPLDAAGLDRAETFETARASVDAAWDERPVRIRAEGTTSQVSRFGFNQSGPGIATMFVLIFTLNGAALLIYERETGTLQRLFTLPVPRWQTLAGKILGQYVYGLGIFTVLVLAGALMGVQWGDNVAGVVLVMLVYTLTVTALGVALATVTRTSAQAFNLSMLFGMTLAPLGGAWWPLEIVPPFMKTVGHLTPVAWSMDAFQEMMFYGGTLADIAPMLGVLLGMAALFFAFGLLRFRYE